MEKKDIASLLDALSERPLAGKSDALSPELEAFCRRAAEALSRTGGGLPDLAADPDRLLALLAALHAGKSSEAEREVFVRAAADSAALRLDGESAFAFLDGLNEPLEPAPAHLLAALETMRSDPAAQPRIWSFASVFSMQGRSWRLAGAFAVLLVAGGLSWSLYGPGWRPTDTAQTVPPPAAAVKAVATKAAPPLAADQPAALADSCPPDVTAQAAKTDKAAVTQEPAPTPGPGCNRDADRQLADKADALAREREAMQGAEAARQAEIARRLGDADRNAAAAAALPADKFGTGAAAMPASPPPTAYGSTPYGNHPAAATTMSPNRALRGQ